MVKHTVFSLLATTELRGRRKKEQVSCQFLDRQHTFVLTYKPIIAKPLSPILGITVITFVCIKTKFPCLPGNCIEVSSEMQ